MGKKAKKSISKFEIWARTVIYGFIKCTNIALGIVVAGVLLIFESFAIYGSVRAYRCAFIIGVVYGVYMILCGFIMVFFIERNNENVLLYFISGSDPISFFYSDYFKYSFNMASHSIIVNESMQRLENIICIEDNEQRIICERLVDEKLCEIVNELKKDNSQKNIEIILKQYSDYRDLYKAKEYNEKVKVRLKQSNLSINFLSLKYCFLWLW